MAEVVMPNGLAVEVAGLSKGCPKRAVYVLSIGRDLFGTPFVQREYGNVSKEKAVRISYVSSDDEARALAARLLKGARTRGYERDG